MKTFQVCFFILVSSVVILACAGNQIQPEESFHFEGFSIRSPNSGGWLVIKKSNTEVIFGKPTPKGVYHTIRAHVYTTRNKVFLSTDDLLSYVKSGFIPTSSRHKNSVLKTSVQKINGVECVLYDFTVEDHGVPDVPGKIFNIIGRGKVCPHPDSPESYIISIDYSERFLYGEKPLSNELERDSFINSLQFIKSF
jgi:hypothetical protein